MQNKIFLLSPRNADPQIIKSLPVPCQGDFIKVKIDLSASAPAYLQVFWSSGNEEFTEENVVSQLILPHINQYVIDLPIKTIKRLRVDPVDRIEKVSIRNIELDIDNQYLNFYSKAITDLRKRCLQDIKFKNSTLTGSVNNSTSQAGMLCLSIPYSDGWKMQLDGQDSKIYKINGGLMGIMIGPGQHDVMLSWTPVFFYPAILISIVGILLYFVLIRIKII